MWKCREMAEELLEKQDEDQFYIAFANCSAEEIIRFLTFLEKYKYLSFQSGTREHQIDGRTIVFAKASFISDFFTRSEYIDHLKFQLKVKREKSARSASQECLVDDNLVESQLDSVEERCDNTSIITKLRSFIQWIKKIAIDDEASRMKDIETFELRRYNTENFYEEDLESYLTRGTILRAIFNDEMEFEIEYFLKDVKTRIEGIATSKDAILEIMEDDKYKFVKSYSSKIIQDLEAKLVNFDSKSSSDMKELVRTVIDPEIEKYENYNSVRNKITIFPLHKKLRVEDPLSKWIALKNCLGRQPLGEIKNYFGVKVATYFAWAGFYTYMLIIASILGLMCTIFGLTVVPYSKLSRDICKSEVIMCPRCDRVCDYWKLKDTCTYSILHHSIDNFATILYTIFMSVWSALYLRQWQRYIAKYNTKWDVINFDYSSQFSRREYVHNIRKLREYQSSSLVFSGTHSYLEVAKRVKLYRITISFFICLLWVILSLGMVFALLLYRMSLITSERLYSDRNSYSIYVVPISTAILDLIGIQFLNFVYGKIAVYLTEAELQRTETEYETSLSIKLFMFQFVNYYSAIFYIAILKGKFIGTPAKYTRVFGFRQEECNPGGCLVELAIQLGIIMIGRQAIKMATPHALSAYQTLKKLYHDRGTEQSENENKIPDYVKNYNLKKFDFMTLMPEYLEMVIQFGFVTLFVAAFPLAPLFALLNNILEVRLDGKKFLKEFRRPLPSRVKGIGVWLNIMSIITKIAAASNAIIIAFSSHFIPKLVYRMNYSPTHSFEGYLNHSLALFNTEHFEPQSMPLQSDEYLNVTKCYYLQYRNSPEAGKDMYKKDVAYWHMMAMRLGFIVVYQFSISLIVMAVEYAVPSIPKKVKNQVRRNARFMMDMEREMNTVLHKK